MKIDKEKIIYFISIITLIHFIMAVLRFDQTSAFITGGVLFGILISNNWI